MRNDPGAARQLAEYQEVSDLIALDAPLRRPDPGLRERVLSAAQADGPLWSPPRSDRAVARHRRAGRRACHVAIGWALRLQGEIGTLREEATALQVAVASDSRRIDDAGPRAGVGRQPGAARGAGAAYSILSSGSSPSSRARDLRTAELSQRRGRSRREWELRLEHHVAQRRTDRAGTSPAARSARSTRSGWMTASA